MDEVQKTLVDVIMLAKQLKDLDATSAAGRLGNSTFEQLDQERDQSNELIVRADQLMMRLRVLREKQFALSVTVMGTLLVSAILLFIHLQIPAIGWIINIVVTGVVIVASIVLTYAITSDSLIVFKDDVEDEGDPLAKSFQVTMPFIIFAITLVGAAALLALFVWLSSRNSGDGDGDGGAGAAATADKST